MAVGPRCQVAKSHSRPLIVEWPASDRMDLETMLRDGGGIVVRYTGCELELLRQCRPKGSYKYVAGTRQDEQVVIRDTDELFAQLPVGATSLEATVAQGQEIDVGLSVVGKYVLGESRLRVRDLEGTGCEGATHVVVGMTAGAFRMVASASRSVGANLVVVEGRSSGKSRVLREGGSPKACGAATSADEHPPNGCGALLRLELSQLECPIAQEYVEGKGCVPTGAQDAGREQGGLDAPLGTLVMESAFAMLNTLQGKERDPRFEVEFDGDLERYARVARKAGNKPRLQIVVGSVRGWSPTAKPDEAVEVRALFHMFPPNIIRWGGLIVRVEETKHAYGLLGSFDHAAPAWQAAHERVLGFLSHSDCKQEPTLSEREIQRLSMTPKQREDLNELISDHEMDARKCSFAKRGTGPWQVVESRLYALFGEAPNSFVLFGVVEPRKDRVAIVDAEVSVFGD